jgi:pyridoxamine 5'-phosphate oxidase
MDSMIDPGTLRQAYEGGRLDEGDLAGTWHEQLSAWFAAAATDPEVLEPNAIQLATVDPAGRPSVRTVLAKRIDERGIVFYTNYESAKARDLAANPRAAAVFVWLAHHRQARLEGTVAKVSRAETEAYYATRPRESQVGAWASPQSQVIESRAALDALQAQVEKRFGDGPIEPPPNWGGYLLTPHSVEFWQGRAGRLHDRIRFRQEDDHWVTERLAP